MSQRVHYDNDIYFLNESIRMLMRNLQLQLDGTFFETKVHREIVFLNEMLSQFFRTLSSNHLLLDRSQNLRFLNKTKRLYCDLLEVILSGTISSHLDLSPHFEEYKKYKEKQENEIADIRALLREVIAGEDQGDLVSSEEYKFLFES